MVTATLLLFTLTLPLMIAAFIQSPTMAALLSAMTQVRRAMLYCAVPCRAALNQFPALECR